MYAFAAVVFIAIVYMLIRSQSGNIAQTFAVVAGKPSSRSFWQPDKLENPIDPRNLTVIDWNPKNCADITLGAEMVIFNSRASSITSPYRHLLHRGSNDLSSTRPEAPGHAGGLNDGLPSEMSPGVFMDRYTNDLIIFVDTDPVDLIYKDVKHSFRESIRVNDIPLNVPFYLHLTLSGKVLEVYVNCRLAGTKLLHGNPRGVENTWFGRTGFAPAQAVVQNLTLWDGLLKTHDVMNQCPSGKIQIKKETWDLGIAGNLPSAKC
jgi:hypothetical protein